MHKGQMQPKSEGQDASMWHYIPSLRVKFVRVFHLDYSKIASSNLLKCKALSEILLENLLASNVGKLIAISRESTTYCFASKHLSSTLGHCALSQAPGVGKLFDIIQSLGLKPAFKTFYLELFQDLIKKM